MRVWVAVAVAVPLTIVCIAARSQTAIDSREGIALQNQILELRRDLQTLQNRSGGSSLGGYQSSPSAAPSSGSGDLTAQLLDRVTQLEDEVRRLRGRLDESENAHKRAEDDLAKQIGDLKFRLDNGGAGAPARPAASSPTLSPPPASLGGGTSPAPPTGPAPRTPERALQEGNAALARRDYPAAEAAAREVLAAGKGPRTTDAQWLLAETMYGRRDYQAAAVAFDDAYQRGPKGSHAQDSLLGLANSLTAINEKKAACETLDKLRAEFPQPRSDLRDPINGARARAGC